MTTLGKILAVFVAVMSLVFVAFIGVTALAGPNWQHLAGQMDDYSFRESGGATPMWEVTHRLTEEVVGNAPSLAEALTIAQRDKKQRQTKKIAALKKQKQAFQATLQREKTASAADAKGIAARLANLQKRLVQLEENVVQVTVQGTEQSQLADNIRSQVAARRTDVERLETELSQVRVDRYRVNEQIEQLEQRLIRIEGQITRAEHRRQLLKDRGTSSQPAPAS